MNILKRPMFLFSLIILFVTVICFYHRNLIMLFAVTFLCFVPFLVYLKRYILLLPLLLCLCVLVNMLSTYKKIDRITLFTKQTVSERFVVTSDPEPKEGYCIAELKCVSHNSLPKGTNVSATISDSEYLVAGDIIDCDIKLKSPSADYKKIYYGNSIYFSGYVKKLEHYDYCDVFYKTLGSLRKYIIKSDYSYLSGDSAALLIAITIGDKSFLSDKLYSAIKVAGVSHMTAVSGLHLAIIIGYFFTLINSVFRNKYLKFIFSVLLVLLLAGVCGFSKSIIRAGLMYVISAFAPIINRDADSLSSLGFSVIIILLFSPFASLSIALQLSYAATFAIIYLAPSYLNSFFDLFGFKSKIVTNAFTLIFDTFFATLVTLPIIINVFGLVSTVCIFANLFLNVFVTAALLLNTVSLIVPVFLLPLRILFFKLAGFVSFLMGKIIIGFSELPFSSVNLGNTAFCVSVILLIITVIITDILNYCKLRRDNAL